MVVSKGKDTPQKHSNLTALLEKIEIVQKNYQLFSIQRAQMLLMGSVNYFFGLTVEKFLKR